jgi:hypothetical protein
LSCSDKESKLVSLEKTICELKHKLTENENSHQKILNKTADFKDKIIEERSVSKFEISRLSYKEYFI